MDLRGKICSFAAPRGYLVNLIQAIFFNVTFDFGDMCVR